MLATLIVDVDPHFALSRRIYPQLAEDAQDGCRQRASKRAIVPAPLTTAEVNQLGLTIGPPGRLGINLQ